MKRLAILALLVPALCPAQEAGQLVSECVAALGGPQAVARWSDYEATGEVTFSMFGRELRGTTTVVQQGRASWQRTEMQFRGRNVAGTQAFDGTQAFMERMGTIADLPALNYQSDLDHSVALLTAPGTSAALTRETEIDGRRVIGVELTAGGKKTTFFVDAETRLLAEIVFEDDYFGRNDTRELLEKRIRYSDYRTIDGTRFPMTQAFFEKGSKTRELRLASVRFAPGVPAERFARPDEELDLRYGEERLD